MGTLTYEIVGPTETDPAKGRISFQSPLGTALLNRAIGDVIEINGRPLGTITKID
jgi:transcription elongation factor GreA